MSVEIKELARQYTPAAMKELGRLSTKAKTESVRVQAIGMLFDRGYGKVPQPIDGDGQGGAIKFYDLSKLTDDELHLLEGLRAKLAAAGGDPSGADKAGD
ncbi:MAG: hypothetical protein ACREHV_09220 [Rhizomicrobium sp.]